MPWFKSWKPTTVFCLTVTAASRWRLCKNFETEKAPRLIKPPDWPETRTPTENRDNQIWRLAEATNNGQAPVEIYIFSAFVVSTCRGAMLGLRSSGIATRGPTAEELTTDAPRRIRGHCVAPDVAAKHTT